MAVSNSTVSRVRWRAEDVVIVHVGGAASPIFGEHKLTSKNLYHNKYIIKQHKELYRPFFHSLRCLAIVQNKLHHVYNSLRCRAYVTFGVARHS